MKTFKLRNFVLFFLTIILMGACKYESSESHEFEYLKIGTLKLMKENLKSSNGHYDTSCYENKTQNCDSIGSFYRGVLRDSICPKGWHLPNTSEILELIEHIPGKINLNNGKLMSRKTAATLGIKYGGGKSLENGSYRYFGKSSQEIWLVSSDSIWTDPNNSSNRFYLTGIHIYSKGKDSVNIEPTFASDPIDFYGYCRCIKD